MAHDVNQSEKEVAAQVRSALVERISSERYDLWIANDTTWNFRSGALTLGFSSEFSCQIAKKMLSREIGLALESVIGSTECEVIYSVVQMEQPQAAPVPWNVASKQQVLAPPKQAQEPIASNGSDGSSLPAVVTSDQAAASQTEVHGEPTRPQPSSITPTNPTPINSVELWSRFVAGNSNQLAWTTANLILSEPGRLTPVLLHGPSGTGKSLVLAALAQRMRGSLRMRRVVHMTSEQFTNDFTEGLRGGGLPMFRRKYRDVEALLLDDIQFFIGKRSTLAEVRHTIDNLLRLGKQVVISADRSLNELQGLGDELVGRLRGGLVTPVFPLDEAIRFELLSQLTNAAGIDIAADVLRQLAGRIAGDGRIIRGLVHRLTAVASLHPGKLTWEQCWSAVFDLVQATQPVVRLGDIERVVCNMFGLEPDSLQSASKIRSVSQPRMLAMFLARKYTPAAYKEIGQYFGKRRHSTVISAEKTVEAWLSENASLESGRQMNVRDAIRHVEAQLQVG